MPHRFARLLLAAAVAVVAVSAIGPSTAEAKPKKKPAVAGFVARSAAAPARGFNAAKFFENLQSKGF
jgi:hypothetical protein